MTRGVVLVTQYVARRHRYVTLGQHAGRDLVEQRLEQVVVGAVDDGDRDRLTAECLRCEQSAKPRADDHDPMRGRAGHAAA